MRIFMISTICIRNSLIRRYFHVQVLLAKASDDSFSGV